MDAGCCAQLAALQWFGFCLVDAGAVASRPFSPNFFPAIRNGTTRGTENWREAGDGYIDLYLSRYSLYLYLFPFSISISISTLTMTVTAASGPRPYYPYHPPIS